MPSNAEPARSASELHTLALLRLRGATESTMKYEFVSDRLIDGRWFRHNDVARSVHARVPVYPCGSLADGREKRQGHETADWTA